MKFVKTTYIDAVTHIPLSEAPAPNGITLPIGFTPTFEIEKTRGEQSPLLYGFYEDGEVPSYSKEISEDEFFYTFKHEMKTRATCRVKMLEQQGVMYKEHLFPISGDIPSKIKAFVNDLEYDEELEYVCIELYEHYWVSLTRQEVSELNKMIVRKQHQLNNWCKYMHDKISNTQLDISCLENAAPILEEINTYTGMEE